ncbi:MAG: hypothetical protein J6W05_02055 [Prevotella sp.]|nr:hypothetical protein [Prevotella sp.]
MEEIRIFKAYQLYGDLFGRTKAVFIYCVLIPLCMVLCIWGMFHDSFALVMRLLSVAIVVLCGWALCYVFTERKYKPGKSFMFFRGSKERLKKIINYGGFAGIIILCLIAYFVYMEEQKIGGLGYFITGIWGIIYAIYYTNKSFKVHEDVDFVTSSEMENIVGVEIGEKIQATYQNFDSSTSDGLQDDANLMIISDKKIYFSFLENGEWSFVKKNINEIEKIGIFDDSQNHQKIHLKLLFSDETSIMLHMESFGKATSNANLFIRKFLEVLDAVVLGTVDEKISSRRRVSVNQETKPVESQQSENKEIRRLDLNNDVMEKLRNATPVESGRVLEF